MKHLILSLCFLGAICSPSMAQLPPTAKAAKSDATLQKIRQLDLLIQLLPLNLKKAQIDTILTVIESIRDKQQKIRSMEDDDLEKLDVDVSAVHKAALEKGAYPTHEFQNKVAALTRAMSIRRSVAIGEMVDEFYTKTQSVLEPGQKTVMEKSLSVAALDPSIKVDKMTTEAKIKFFIRQIFIDVNAYPMLIELRKTAP